METKNNKLYQLQFLRFIAFLFIFIYHCDLYKIEILNVKSPKLAAFAVSFFFVLSGFGTGYSFYGKKITLNIKETFKDITKKLKKFYPLYFIMTILFFFLLIVKFKQVKSDFNPLDFSSFIQLFKNLILIQSWFKDGYFSFCGVGWFLSTIMFLYLFNVPTKYLLNKINEKKYSIIIFIIFFAIINFLIIYYCYLVRNKDIAYYTYIFPPSRLGEYISGMILGFNICKFEQKKKTNSKILFTILEISIFFIIYLYLRKINFLNWQFYSIKWLFIDYLVLTIFGIGKGYISKLFSNKILVTLGNISFECFLIHTFIISIYTNIIKNKTNNITSFFIILTIVVIISLIINSKDKVIKKLKVRN